MGYQSAKAVHATRSKICCYCTCKPHTLWPAGSFATRLLQLLRDLDPHLHDLLLATHQCPQSE